MRSTATTIFSTAGSGCTSICTTNHIRNGDCTCTVSSANLRIKSRNKKSLLKNGNRNGNTNRTSLLNNNPQVKAFDMDDFVCLQNQDTVFTLLLYCCLIVIKIKNDRLMGRQLDPLVRLFEDIGKVIKIYGLAALRQLAGENGGQLLEVEMTKLVKTSLERYRIMQSEVVMIDIWMVLLEVAFRVSDDIFLRLFQSRIPS
uniref:Uncharacterized protein n=1 Tax=Cucumis melo TaxID=3656 RepID=A0A9I9EHV4_CUCME